MSSPVRWGYAYTSVALRDRRSGASVFLEQNWGWQWAPAPRALCQEGERQCRGLSPLVARRCMMLTLTLPRSLLPGLLVLLCVPFHTVCLTLLLFVGSPLLTFSALFIVTEWFPRPLQWPVGLVARAQPHHCSLGLRSAPEPEGLSPPRALTRYGSEPRLWLPDCRQLLVQLKGKSAQVQQAPRPALGQVQSLWPFK